MKLKYPIEAYEALGISNENSQNCMNEGFEYKHCALVASGNCEESYREYATCMGISMSLRRNNYVTLAMGNDWKKMKEENISKTAVEQVSRGFFVASQIK